MADWVISEKYETIFRQENTAILEGKSGIWKTNGMKMYRPNVETLSFHDPLNFQNASTLGLYY